MSSLFYHATKFLETNLYLCSDWSMFQHDAGLQIRLLDNPQVRQLADATGDFACLVFIFWPLTDVFFHVYLNIILR